MALTYLPNANKVELGGDRSAAPLVVGVVALLLVVGLGWGFYSWLSPAASEPVVTSSGPVKVPGGDTPPVPAVYGTEGEFFKVAFTGTPLAAADTGSLRVTFPAAATVSGYAQTTTPLDVYENTDDVPAPGTHVVMTSSLPAGGTYNAAQLEEILADLPTPLTEITRFGYKGFQIEGTAADLVKPEKGEKLSNPNAKMYGIYIVKGATGYFVYAVDNDMKTAQAFVDSFVPVKNKDVPNPPAAAK